MMSMYISPKVCQKTKKRGNRYRAIDSTNGQRVLRSSTTIPFSKKGEHSHQGNTVRCLITRFLVLRPLKTSQSFQITISTKHGENKKYLWTLMLSNYFVDISSKVKT